MKFRQKAQCTQSLPKIPVQKQCRYLTQKEDEEDLDFSFEISPVNLVTTKQDFYKLHKTTERQQEQNKMYNRNDNLMTTLSSSQLPPGSFGLFNRQKNDALHLNHMKYGDKYMIMLARGLQKQNDIKEFNLNDNRMTQLSSSEVIKSTRGATSLSLSKNKIGNGCLEIGNSLVNRDCKIQLLNLEDNKLQESLIIDILDRIAYNRSLKIVNLSKNNISNNCVNALSNMLITNEDIAELYLHFNKLNGIAAVQIFNNMHKSNLKVLDLSQNSLGIGYDWSQSFNKMVQLNKELIHFDLSFNKIDYQITCQIAEGLKKNKSILGFHYTGNCGYVDPKGFLIPIQKGIVEQTQHQIAQRIQGCQYIKQKRLRSYRDSNIKDCCWICEGWRQIEFQWNPQTSGPANDPMFLHLSYLNYDDLYMGKVESGLRVQRMVPPGLSYYFFTNDNMQCVAKDQLHKRWPLPLNKVKVQDKEIDVKLHQLNYMNVLGTQIIDKYYMPIINVQPRQEDLLYIPERVDNRILWTFPISLFKDWKRDNEELIEKCFISDWNQSRITKLIKDDNDRNACYNFLLSNYQQIKDTYKHYACLSPIGDIWAISSLINLQLLSTVRMTEPNEKGIIKQQDMELKYLATISGTEKGNYRKPERGMVRFQFLEMFVRIAEDKYIKNGIAKSFEEALQWMWNDHLKEEFNKYNTQIFRDTKFWNEQCDLCMKHYKTILDSIYIRYSVKKVKPGQKPFMSLQELQEMCAHIGLNQIETFGPNIPLFAFNKAMMTQIDELNSDRIFQMSFVEFLEAFARIAEDIDIRQIGLHLKIEQLIWKCYVLFSDLYALPIQSYFQEEWDQINKQQNNNNKQIIDDDIDDFN
ncbi:unnamed protein product [Paramecium primaurelia]|uniref:Leucine Rich Repeat family protein n=1 Tax=Paramecium primaurelia TaxID=5886 RepID=A0A8S1KD76_PARPR|nr:unnamed protein product [Paramecium primaurelia]